MWKTTKLNNIQSSIYRKAITSRNIAYRNIEEVYKLNFAPKNLSGKIVFKRDEAINSRNKKTLPDFIQLSQSMERIKKFMPNLSDLINVSSTKRLEKEMVNRFENQETERIMKRDLKQITDKKNDIEKSIIDNISTLEKLNNQISDIRLSIYAHSKMEQKPIILTPNKNLKNKNITFDQRTFSENNIKKEKKHKINKIERAKQIRLDFDRRLKILNQRLNKKKEEISEKKKILPELELNRKEILSKIKSLKKEKKDLSIIKNDLSEKLYFHYLNILKEGVDTRNQGFSYIIKEILNLDKKVLLSYFPDYLDLESIKYLLKQAKLKFKLEEKSNQIKKLKNYFSETLLMKKRKGIKEINDKIKNDTERIIENNKNNIIEKDTLLDYCEKKSQKFNRNRKNNSFWNSNGFSKLDSTSKSTFSNINIRKNLDNIDMSFKKEEINKSNFMYNNFNEKNKLNDMSSDFKKNFTPKDKIFIKNQTKINHYKKLLYNHRILNNFSFSEKKINLSNFNSIPEKLSISQVEDYLKTKENIINEKNIKKIVQYFKLDKKLKKINDELEENKKNEMTRIYNKYLKKEYSQKYILEKEKVLSALIGEDNVQSEIRRQIIRTKLFFKSNNLFNKNII